MSGAMTQMQEQMKNMPPEARARMEAMMKGRGMAPAGSAPITYAKIGTDKVGKWTCDKYEGSRDGEKVSELCTVPPATLGFTPGDFEVTKQMAEFFAKLVPQGGDQMFRIGTATANGFSGVPVRTVTFTNGAPRRDDRDHRGGPPELPRLDVCRAGGLHQARHDGRSRTRTTIAAG